MFLTLHQRLIFPRIIASLTSGVIALAFGLPMKAAIGVVIVDVIIKSILYIGHERVWAGVKP